MICEGLNFFVVGQTFDIFSFGLFMHGVYFSIPGVCVLVHLFSILRVIRLRNANRSGNFVPAFVAYLVLGLVTWCLIFPQTISLAYGIEDANKSIVANKISTGYFRENGGGVYYYSRVHDNGDADGLFIDSKGYTGLNGSVTPFINSNTKIVSADPFVDILVRNAINKPKVVSYPVKVYSTILDVAKKSWNGGKFAWLCFSTIGLALISIYGVQFGSSWNMVNVVFVLLTGVAIVFLNFILHTLELPAFVINNLDKLPFLIQLEGSVLNPLAVYMNVLLSFFFGATGFVLAIFRIRKIKKGVFVEGGAEQ